MSPPPSFIRVVAIHEKTGVLCTFAVRTGTHNPQPSGEPHHILIRGEIGMGKDRKRGVWEYAGEFKGYPAQIYFTCPWCGAIGKSMIGSDLNGMDSIICGMMTTRRYEDQATYGCKRHLTLAYREPGKEQEGFIYDR